MPAASTTLSTTGSQQPTTKTMNNSSLHSSKKKTKWSFKSAISKKPVDAASKANDISNNNHRLNNDKTTRHFHDSKLDLSRPSKVVCSRFNSSSSKLSCNSCATDNTTDNTDTDNTPSSPTNSLRFMNDDDIEMILDDDSQETSPNSSITWVEDLTDQSFPSVSPMAPQLSNITTNNVIDLTSSPSQLNDNVSTNKFMVRTLSLLRKFENDERDSSKSRLRSRSRSFNDLLNKENGQVVDESVKDLSSKFSSKRKKCESTEFRPISLPDPSLLNHDSLVSGTNDTMRCDSPVSDVPSDTLSDPPNTITFINKRCSLNEFYDIRRSWSHIEVRHLKNIFSKKRVILDGKRRNSYAYTNSIKTNQQIAAESEIRLLNHLHKTRNSNVKVVNVDDNGNVDTVIKDPPTVPSSPVLQVDVEKEIDVTTKSIQMRKFISCEIYSTEQSYLSHLKDLKRIFMDPFIDAAQQPNPLVNPDDIETIFAHISDLIVLSTIIVEDLESSMDPWQESESMVGEVFLKYRPYFETLLLYAENHEQKLKKYTPECHMDYDDLCHAVDNMKTLALQCDKAIQQL
ncbi:224_t:CDS:2, partial [Racocetra fulgida]